MLKVTLQEHLELDYNLNEAYKTLRTNLEFCGDDVRVIMLTSSTQNEGKSTVAYNLCASLAQSGKKVLLIDADLRKSVLVGRHKVGVKVDGLSHFLSGQKKLEDVLCETNIENFHAIFAGPVTPNPTELLGNQYFEDLISQVRQAYDYVIVDAPPLGLVIDAAIISKVCDGAILVIENNSISYRFAQTVKKQLETAGCKIIGAILNKVDIEKSGYYQGYYKKYYGKYYGYGKTTK